MTALAVFYAHIMSRSYKNPWVWISKRSTHLDRRAFRHDVKQACHEIEIDFDPDVDFDEYHKNIKEFGDWGTKFGFDIPPTDADSTWMHESYEDLCRK